MPHEYGALRLVMVSPSGNCETKRRTHEAKINMSLVNLLYTIFLSLSTKAKWDDIHHSLDLHTGEAEYKAIVDGDLVDPDGEMQVLLESRLYICRRDQ